MNDDRDLREHERRLRRAEVFGASQPTRMMKAPGGSPAADGEDACAAFGFLRGITDRALALEFRLRSGDSEGFPYSHLAGWRYNRSVGLLLKFTSDVTTLMLIRGSNLDAELPGRTINLTDRGLQRHRITYLREMDEDELRRAGEREPTIDRIAIAEFESQEAAAEWIKKHAPALLRR